VTAHNGQLVSISRLVAFTLAATVLVIVTVAVMGRRVREVRHVYLFLLSVLKLPTTIIIVITLTVTMMMMRATMTNLMMMMMRRRRRRRRRRIGVS
jgi:uncharacterized membrane protein